MYLNSVELAKERVALRVSRGGHTIPGDVIKRRYHKGLNHFSLYAEVADDWYVYDNSGSNYELVASRENGEDKITNFEIFSKVYKNG